MDSPRAYTEHVRRCTELDDDRAEAAARDPDTLAEELAAVVTGGPLAIALSERQRCIEVCRSVAQEWRDASERAIYTEPRDARCRAEGAEQCAGAIERVSPLPAHVAPAADDALARVREIRARVAAAQLEPPREPRIGDPPSIVSPVPVLAETGALEAIASQVARLAVIVGELTADLRALAKRVARIEARPARKARR